MRMRQLTFSVLLLLITATTVCAGNRAVQVESLLAGLRDTAGKPLSGGKVWTYEAGTSTLKTTWTDAGKTTNASNPITLDAGGKATVFADGLYKFRITTSTGTTVATLDNLKYRYNGTNSVTVIGNYTATLDDDLVMTDASSDVLTVVLPDATLATAPISVKKIDSSANAVTIQAQSGQTIDGDSSMVLATTGDSTTLYSDGTVWRGLNKIVTASSATNADHALVADKADTLKDNGGTYRSLNSGTTANTVPLRNADGNLPGNITGAAASATTAGSVAWSGITSKPTTVSGYGITDMSSQTCGAVPWSGVSSKPTTVSGYGITDMSSQTCGAVPWSGVSSKPTTVSGYGITNAITTGNIGSQSVNYAATAPWSGISSKPTTVSGYGITDMSSQTCGAVPWSGVSSKPTTVAGYGITDAVTTSTTPAFVYGRVAADGTLLNGSGATVSKTGTGAYTITFSSAFSANAVLTCTAAPSGAGTLSTICVGSPTSGCSTTACYVITVDGQNGTRDSSFYFQIMGAR